MTGQVEALGAAEIKRDVPFWKGSVFEEGMERTIWLGAVKEGSKRTELRVRWAAGSKSRDLRTVNSRQRKNAGTARQIAVV